MRRGLRIAPWAPWGLLYGFCGLMLLFLVAPIVIVLLVSFSDGDSCTFLHRGSRSAGMLI
jgi:ABC-type spermidine/putrescine transport system permease subunit II